MAAPVLAAAAVALAMAWCPTAARADWDAQSGCLDEPRLHVLVERALGAAVPAETSIEGRVGGGPGAWRAHLRVSRGASELERELTSEAELCAALDDAVVVVTALLVDELSTAEPVPLLVPDAPPAATEAVPAVVPAVVPAPYPEPPPIREEVDPLTLSVRAHGALRVDEVAGPSGLAGLEVELGTGPVAVLLGMHFMPPVEAGEQDGVRVRYVGGVARLGGCLGAGFVERMEAGGCVLGSLAYVIAEASGLTESTGADGVSLLGSLEAWLRFQLFEPLWLRVSAGLGVPLVRARTVYLRDGVPTAFHEASWVVPELGLGIEMRLP